MMLTFRDQLDQIISGEKTMTTRLDAKGHYLKAWNRGVRKLDPWFRNPCTLHPDCYKIGVVKWDDMERSSGSLFTTNDARRDGFDGVEDYITALGKSYNLDRTQVLCARWSLIKWRKDGWIDGPHPRKVA